MQGANQIVPQPDGKVQMLSSTFAAKASTKYEVYLLLVTSVKCYLPRPEHVTIVRSFSPSYLFL